MHALVQASTRRLVRLLDPARARLALRYPNPKVAGSNPAPAIERPAKRELFGLLRWVQKWAPNTVAVRRAFVGVVLREQSGREELPSRGRA